MTQASGTRPTQSSRLRSTRLQRVCETYGWDNWRVALVGSGSPGRWYPLVLGSWYCARVCGLLIEAVARLLAVMENWAANTRRCRCFELGGGRCEQLPEDHGARA